MFRTPLVTETPSGGFHLWYAHAGERCGSLRHEGLCVDIKGRGGVVVVPPSRRLGGEHAGRAYRFRCGSWSDLKRLPALAERSLVPRRDAPASGDLATDRGRRNDTLFRRLLQEARACDDLEALLDVAHSLNDSFLPPLPAAEVEKIARSAWSYEADPEKENWAGAEQRIGIRKGDLYDLAAEPAAPALYMVPQARRGGDTGPRALAPKAMAACEVVPGWRHPQRYRRARDLLLMKGYLACVHRGGKSKGDPSLYVLRSSQGAKGARTAPNRTKHPPPG